MAGPYKLAWDERSSLLTNRKKVYKNYTPGVNFFMLLMFQQNKLERLSTLKFLEPSLILLKECVLSYPQIID